MVSYAQKDAYYYLRSLPVFAATLVYFILLRVHPEFVRQLNSYLVDSNPEDNFSQYGWSLYYLIIPFSIAALSRIKRYWPMIIGLFLYPIALCFSYWLWELLGWVVMGCALCGLVGMGAIDDSTDDTSHNIYFGLVITACVLYAILRIIGGLGSSGLLGVADVGLVVLIGGYFLCAAIVDVFKWEESYKTIVYPSGITMLYIFLLAGAMMLMGGSDGWGSVALSGADRKKYNSLILRAEQSQQEEHYRYAAVYYTEAAAIRSQQRNQTMAAAMNHKADSVEAVLKKKIPADLNALRKEKRNSPAFNEHANTIERDIEMLETNASKVTPKTTIEDYKKRLETQRKRKK